MKKLISIAAIVILSLGLIGCQKKPVEVTTPTTPTGSVSETSTGTVVIEEGGPESVTTTGTLTIEEPPAVTTTGTLEIEEGETE